MTLDEYLKSPDFQLFQDEILRAEAMRAVETILTKTSLVKRHQLHSIPAAIQGEGYAGLSELVGKQKEKNSSEKIKAFWIEMDGILSPTANSDISLFGFVKSMLTDLEFLDDEDRFQDKKEKKQARKRNKAIVESVRDQVLAVYFEHFNCHYFYKSQQGGEQ